MKKRSVWRVYRAYKLGKVDRVKGPGLDVHVGDNACCGGCMALFLNMAYQEGRKS